MLVTPLPTIRVLLVDDHFVVRSGLITSLEIEDDICVVAEGRRGEDAVELYSAHRPDVVLMDLQLPGISGIEATAQLRILDPAARVLVFSSFARIDEVDAALTAGAAGILQKSSSREELLEALRLVAEGGSYLPPDIAPRLEEARRHSNITPREREVLAQIAQGRANKEIAVHCGISEDTVKRHVSHIIEKLAVNDRAEAVTEAMRRGILKVPE